VSYRAETKGDLGFRTSALTYPWPAAQAVLDARAKFLTATLADLYDPLTMPAELLKVHQELDCAVDRCYRPEAFTSDRQRVEYLVALYEKIATPLVATAKAKRRRKRW